MLAESSRTPHLLSLLGLPWRPPCCHQLHFLHTGNCKLVTQKVRATRRGRLCLVIHKGYTEEKISKDEHGIINNKEAQSTISFLLMGEPSVRKEGGWLPVLAMEDLSYFS